MTGRCLFASLALLSFVSLGCGSEGGSDATAQYTCEETNNVQLISTVDSDVVIQVRNFDGTPAWIDVMLPAHGSKMVGFTGGGTLNALTAIQLFPAGVERNSSTLIDTTTCQLSPCLATWDRHVTVNDAAQEGMAPLLVIACSVMPPI